MRRVHAGAWSLAVFAILVGGMILPADEPKDDAKKTGEVRQFPYGNYIYQVAFSPDGKLVVTDDQVWDAATGKKIRTLPLPPLDRRPFLPFRLAFSPDSRKVAIHRFDDLVLVEVATGKQVWNVKLGPRKHRSAVPGLAFTPDGKHLVTSRPDEGLVRVWTVATGREVRSFAYDPVGGGLSGAILASFGISADSKRVVVHSHETILVDRGGQQLLDLATGKILARYRLSSGADRVDYSAPLPDGRHLIYAKKNGLRLIDLETGKETRRFETVGELAFTVVCSPDGKRVAACIRPRKDVRQDWIECWDVATGKSLRVIKAFKGTLGDLVFSPDGKFILSAHDDKTARLWRVEE
jgi:WD40 repeat protein